MDLGYASLHAICKSLCASCYIKGLKMSSFSAVELLGMVCQSPLQSVGVWKLCQPTCVMLVTLVGQFIGFKKLLNTLLMTNSLWIQRHHCCQIKRLQCTWTQDPFITCYVFGSYTIYIHCSVSCKPQSDLLYSNIYIYAVVSSTDYPRLLQWCHQPNHSEPPLPNKKMLTLSKRAVQQTAVSSPKSVGV